MKVVLVNTYEHRGGAAVACTTGATSPAANAAITNSLAGSAKSMKGQSQKQAGNTNARCGHNAPPRGDHNCSGSSIGCVFWSASFGRISL